MLTRTGTNSKPKEKEVQKLSSTPASLRQDSPIHEQSVARSDALAHLFDDLPDPLNTPIAPIASTPALLATNIPSGLPVEQHNHRALVDSAVPSNQLDRTRREALPELDTQQEALPVVDTRIEVLTGSCAALSPPLPQTSSVQTPDSDSMASANNFITTGQFRNMRACMICSIVRTQQQFLSLGCPNCTFLELRGNQEMVGECTSQVFEGLITISDTSRSWVARWQRLEGYVPGCYAVQVEGVLPDEAITSAEENGVHYIPRDGSVNEALPTDA